MTHDLWDLWVTYESVSGWLSDMGNLIPTDWSVGSLLWAQHSGGTPFGKPNQIEQSVNHSWVMVMARVVA